MWGCSFNCKLFQAAFYLQLTHSLSFLALFVSRSLSVCRMPSLWRRGGSSCRATFVWWWTNWSRHCRSSQPAPPKRPCCLCCLSVSKWTHWKLHPDFLCKCVELCVCGWERIWVKDANVCVQVQASCLGKIDATLQKFEEIQTGKLLSCVSFQQTIDILLSGILSTIVEMLPQVQNPHNSFQ